jgi:UrcA family protein
MKQALIIALTSALITTGVIKAAPAFAQSPTTSLNVSLVQTADLDLGSAKGQRQLDLRIARAARQVCGAASDADVEGKNDVRKCRDETIAKAQQRRDAVLAARGGDDFVAVTAAR